MEKYALTVASLIAIKCEPRAEVEVEYVVATSDDDLYFMACNERCDKQADRETMVHTTLQRVFSVLACKQRMEKVKGPLSSLNAPWKHNIVLALRR